MRVGRNDRPLLLSKHTGQEAETIAEDFERDRWMDAQAAKEYGLVDQIINGQKS